MSDEHFIRTSQPSSNQTGKGNLTLTLTQTRQVTCEQCAEAHNSLRIISSRHTRVITHTHIKGLLYTHSDHT